VQARAGPRPRPVSHQAIRIRHHSRTPTGASIPGPTEAPPPTVPSSRPSRTSSSSSPPARPWPSSRPVSGPPAPAPARGPCPSAGRSRRHHIPPGPGTPEVRPVRQL